MDPTEDYLWVSGITLFDMRLIIDGAVNVYEEGNFKLGQLIKRSEDLTPYIALETIGAALYTLQHLIRDLQKRQAKEALQS